jgi:hypothetical protein
VIVRPVIQTNGPMTNAYRAHAGSSRADVVDFHIKQIDGDTFLHKTPVLTS